MAAMPTLAAPFRDRDIPFEEELLRNPFFVCREASGWVALQLWISWGAGGNSNVAHGRERRKLQMETNAPCDNDAGVRGRPLDVGEQAEASGNMLESLVG